ncbi:MAG: heme exporter protein CcmD [Alphaproteobacteria bacterium]|nr:heme exporter protein CcmD [Alphaproteobacteria bacterium]
MDLGPHADFILASYAVYAVVLAALAAWLVYDGVHQQRLLDDLEARGATRRSRAGRAEKNTKP